MLKESSAKAKSMMAYGVGIIILLPWSGKIHAQDIEESVTIDEQVAAVFCKDLREAVKTQDRRKISSWIYNFPIEIQRNNKNILVVDNAAFIRKFDLIFDAAIQSTLFGPSGCESKQHLNGETGLANDEIFIEQIGKEVRPHISEISPPADTDPSSYVSSDRYEEGAKEFFTKLQEAIAADNKPEVGVMCMYPISITIVGKRLTIRNRAQLAQYYPQIFTPAMKKAVTKLPSPIHVGWRGFMTDRGELWFDWVVWTHVYRVISINGAD
jgi:hypothetical protein